MKDEIDLIVNGSINGDNTIYRLSVLQEFFMRLSTNTMVTINVKDTEESKNYREIYIHRLWTKILYTIVHIERRSCIGSQIVDHPVNSFAFIPSFSFFLPPSLPRFPFFLPSFFPSLFLSIKSDESVIFFLYGQHNYNKYIILSSDVCYCFKTSGQTWTPFQ